MKRLSKSEIAGGRQTAPQWNFFLNRITIDDFLIETNTIFVRDLIYEETSSRLYKSVVPTITRESRIGLVKNSVEI